MTPKKRAAARKRTPRRPTAAAVKQVLVADAKNRALRTFLQGVAIDVLLAVSVLAYSLATSPDPIVWALVPGSLARSVAQAGAAYVMRRFLDRSRVPTPLPPADDEPDEVGG